MISVIIPTLNAERRLAVCLEGLVAAAVAGLVREVIVCDGGSTDRTVEIADAAGARVVPSEKGRGAQLAAGASAARGAWLLFLHGDTVLEDSWTEEIGEFLSGDRRRIGVFSLRFDKKGFAPAVVAKGAMLRTRLLASPYGDQGLLISRQLFDEIGGYRAMALFEDVDIIDRVVRRAGRKALHIFHARAITSTARYERGGYFGRVLRNTLCLAMYRAGVAPEKILRLYEK